jgi:hypothetical protein
MDASDPSLSQTTNTEGESSLLALLSCLARTVPNDSYGTVLAVGVPFRSHWFVIEQRNEVQSNATQQSNNLNTPGWLETGV